MTAQHDRPGRLRGRRADRAHPATTASGDPGHRRAAARRARRCRRDLRRRPGPRRGHLPADLLLLLRVQGRRPAHAARPGHRRGRRGRAGRAFAGAVPAIARARWRAGHRGLLRDLRAHRASRWPAPRRVATNAEVRALWARVLEGWVQRCAAAIEAERRRGAAPPGVPARDLAIALNSMNERVLLRDLQRRRPGGGRGRRGRRAARACGCSAIYGPVGAEPVGTGPVAVGPVGTEPVSTAG